MNTTKARRRNVANKERRLSKQERPYAKWVDPYTGWTYHLLKSWQVDNSKEYARWFCRVEGDFDEAGDCYVADLLPGLRYARRLGALGLAEPPEFDETVWPSAAAFYAWALGAAA